MKALITKLDGSAEFTEITISVWRPVALFIEEDEAGYEEAIAARNATIEAIEKLHLGTCKLLQVEGE